MSIPEQDQELEDIKDEELPEPYSTIARLCGKDAALTLMREFGGLLLYFPKEETVTQAARNRRIKQDYLAGASPKTLARRYNVTEVWIRTILSDVGARVHPNQILMFEDKGKKEGVE